MSQRHDRPAAFARALEAELTTRNGGGLSLDGPGTHSLAAWFLGPRAENAELLRELVAAAVTGHVTDRETLFEDPPYVTPEIKASAAYRDTVAFFRTETDRLIERLKGSVPFFSYRYQGHMNWDVSMPAVVGYFAAMLYNQNNVAAEASPITTPLEMAVGNDLCTMLGYVVPPPGKTGEVAPWGHITCDGSVANLEAMWASRNLKFYPLSLAAALREQPSLAAARGIEVGLPTGGRAPLLELTTWQLLNLGADDVLGLATVMQDRYDISSDTLTAALADYTLQALGWDVFNRRMGLGDVNPPVLLAPSTMHYSWPKGAAVLGIGANSIVGVDVDLDARMDLDSLRARLAECLAARTPVIMTVAVIGTTEESAVDPLDGVLAVREEFRAQGLDFTVHADAAWGGYFASLLRPGADGPEADANGPIVGRPFSPELCLSRYVTRQYEALGRTDSITVDPHKAGYVPYAAGGLCYRNSAMRNLVSFTAPVVYHGGIDPTVGVYGIEGSKPGATAAGVYLSHRVIRTDQTGYGRILGQSLFNSKRLYCSILTMVGDDEPFVVVPFQRLPAEREGRSPADVARQVEFIRNRIVPVSDQELVADVEAMALFRELGSDQNIIAYAFNLRTPLGVNPDVAKANALNQAVFEALSLSPDHDKVRETPLFVTSSDFEPGTYSREFMQAFRSRMGLRGDESADITFLLSTTMDPWVTETSEGSLIPVLTDALRTTVRNAVKSLTG